MKSIANATTSIAIDDAFLDIGFQTDDSADPGGNGGNPSVLRLRVEQLEAVEHDDRDSSVSIRFVGTQEFLRFHSALTLLVRELDEIYGPASTSGARVSVHRVRVVK